MDRDRLEGYLGSGLSLEEIGLLQNRDASTVGYWVAKHGLVANGRQKHAARGGLTREQLEPLVDRGATLSEIARELGRSTSTVRHWMKKHGLELRRARRNRAEQAAAEAAGLKRFVARCQRHGTVEFVRRPDGGWRCQRCRSEDVINWRRRKKQRLVEAAGGACLLCGYDRYVGALQFHHRDPRTKRFSISRAGITRAFSELEEEAKKCVLLCANCHAEAEGGLHDLTLK